jgi:hypothetical protein
MGVAAGEWVLVPIGHPCATDSAQGLRLLVARLRTDPKERSRLCIEMASLLFNSRCPTSTCPT